MHTLVDSHKIGRRQWDMISRECRVPLSFPSISVSFNYFYGRRYLERVDRRTQACFACQWN